MNFALRRKLIKISAKIALAILIVGGTSISLAYLYVATHSPAALAGARWNPHATTNALQELKANARLWRSAHGKNPESLGQINPKGWRPQFKASGGELIDAHSKERIWMTENGGVLGVALDGVDAYSCKELASNFLYYGLAFEQVGRGPWYSAFVVNGRKLRISGKQAAPHASIPMQSDLISVLNICGDQSEGGRLTVIWEGL